MLGDGDIDIGDGGICRLAEDVSVFQHPTGGNYSGEL